MGKYTHCNMTLITQKGCGACGYIKEKILPFEDVGVDHIDIQTPEDSDTVFREYPDVKHVPTLILNCGNNKPDYLVGVEKIASILMDADKGDIHDVEV